MDILKNLCINIYIVVKVSDLIKYIYYTVVVNNCLTVNLHPNPPRPSSSSYTESTLHENDDLLPRYHPPSTSTQTISDPFIKQPPIRPRSQGVYFVLEREVGTRLPKSPRDEVAPLFIQQTFQYFSRLFVLVVPCLYESDKV